MSGTFTVRAKNIIINAEEDLIIQAKGSIINNAGGSVIQHGGKEGVEFGKYVDYSKPKIIELKWMDNQCEESISSSKYGKIVSIFARTNNMKEGDSIKLKVNQNFTDGSVKPITVEGKVDKNGVAILQNVIKVK